MEAFLRSQPGPALSMRQTQFSAACLQIHLLRRGSEQPFSLSSSPCGASQLGLVTGVTDWANIPPSLQRQPRLWGSPQGLESISHRPRLEAARAGAQQDYTIDWGRSSRGVRPSRLEAQAESNKGSLIPVHFPFAWVQMVNFFQEED